jgi:uncharacterized protein
MNEIYTYTVPLFIKSLGGLKAVLQKTEAFVKAQGMDEAEFLERRLWPDMFPFKKQVQIACDNAKLGTARLSGMEAPKMDDAEATFAELLARIDQTLAFLDAVPEASFAGAAERQVTLSYVPGKYLTGFDYTRTYLIPNFFFHTVTAYAIARTAGVPVGKGDYTNGIPFQDLPA